MMLFPYLRFRLVACVVLLASASLWRCSPGAKSYYRTYTFDKQVLADADGKFKQKKFSEAIAQYDDIVKQFPRTESARIALFKIGFANIYFENSQPDWSAALKAFRLFQKQYGDDPKIEEVNTWIRILVAMESFAASYGESSARIQKLKTKTLEKSESVEQLREEILKCSFEKDSCNLEKNALIQKIKELESTILKIERAQ